MRTGKRGGFNLTFPYTFKILNFIFVMVRGRGGGTEKIILFMFYGGGGGNEDFVDIWGGGVSNRTSFRGHFYAILGPLLSSLYRIQNGDILGVAHFSFIYLSIYF